MYLIPKEVYLKDQAAFASDDSIQPDVQNKCEALLRGVKPLYMSDENMGVDDDAFRGMVTAKMADGGSNIALWMYGRTTA